MQRRRNNSTSQCRVCIFASKGYRRENPDQYAAIFDWKGAEESQLLYRDNTSVSRCHAKISKQGWQYYIEDQNSTNGTYVEGKALHPYQETALSDNVTIRLSDEVFEFHFM